MFRLPIKVLHPQANAYPWVAYITDQSEDRHGGCSSSLVRIDWLDWIAESKKKKKLKQKNVMPKEKNILLQ